MKATEPAAALFALASLLVILIVAPVAAHSADLHDELRWTEGFRITPQPQARPSDPPKSQPAPAKPKGATDPALNQHAPRRR